MLLNRYRQYREERRRAKLVATLLRVLREGQDDQESARAALALAQMRHDGVVEHLIRILEDVDVLPPEESASPRTKKQKGPEGSERYEALLISGEVLDDVVDPEVEVRGDIHSGSSLRSSTARFSLSGEDRFRLAITRALRSFREPNAARAFIATLYLAPMYQRTGLPQYYDYWEAKKEAAEALVDIGTPAVPAILEALRNSVRRIRDDSVSGRINHELSKVLIVETGFSPSKYNLYAEMHLRPVALLAKATGEIGDARGEPVLRALLEIAAPLERTVDTYTSRAPRSQPAGMILEWEFFPWVQEALGKLARSTSTG